MSAREKVAIVGSREGIDELKVVEYVQGLPIGTTVVSGGARGVDTWVEKAARARCLFVEVYCPDWKKGPGAALERNTAIVENSDRVVAFWNGTSKGTKDVINKANYYGKPLTVFWPEEDFMLS